MNTAPPLRCPSGVMRSCTFWRETRPGLTAICLLVLAGLLTSAPTFPAQAQDETKELRVVTRMLPPIILTDQGELSGFGIDLWNAIAEQMQVRTAFNVAADVGALLERVRSRKADLGVAAVSITPARAREFDFSEPILSGGLQIMVRGEDAAQIKGPEDLRRRRVATTRQSTSAAFLRDIKARVYSFAVIKHAYSALLDKKVDAIVFDAPVLLNYADYTGKGHVQMVGPLFRKEDYGIVFPRNSPLRKQVNDALSGLRKDGTYQKLYDRWFTN